MRTLMKPIFILSLLLWSFCIHHPAFTAEPLVRLRVSDNHRFLVTETGQAFFYLGDTAWELFHRLNREEAVHYLQDRADKGFTVIQAVALAEMDGLHTSNAYGERPLVDDDPSRPDVKDGPADDYWDHVDFIVAEANKHGLYLGFLPTWGDKWNRGKGAGPEIFTPENAESYGLWLGQRYRNAALIWILGGDRTVETERHKDITRAMARGLRKGDGGAHLITFHPRGGSGSAEVFHDEPWLDFNMRQNGHTAEFNPRYAATRVDYERTPIKPVLDGEPIYEDHPVSFKAADFGHSTASDVRRPLYWNLFTGACGHTYGHHSVWQMWSPPREPKNNPLLPWTAALDQPGATQMRHAKALMLSRPFLSRVPDDSVIVESEVKTAVPGAGRYRFTATRDAAGSYAMVYAPIGRAFKVRMEKITGPQVTAWWFDPREGKAQHIGDFPNAGEREFISPDRNEDRDWILVLDDAAKNFPPPGSQK